MPYETRATHACRITGRSMQPDIYSGDVILLQYIEDFSWLPLGDIYAIVTTNDMRTVKRLQRGLTLYWARYSWATYAAELDVSKDTISEALRHSYGSNITGVYIQFKREKIDVANRKVIDYALKGKTD